MLHKCTKKLLRRNNNLPNTVKLISFLEKETSLFEIKGSKYVNEIKIIDNVILKNEIYPVENFVESGLDSKYPLSFQKKKVEFTTAKTIEEASNLWPMFLDSSVIPDEYRNAGIHYGGYIKECQEWCLPSWIWTNAALVRYYCTSNQIEKAKYLGDLILSQQLGCGGWIVRNDYTRKGVTPQLAPNDSCYIALNCCLALYDKTNEDKYLQASIRNANWTMETARTDGMVWFAYDTLKNEWIKDRNIVDIGFTAGLFARLYEITGNECYRIFLEKFIKTYIKVFYMPSKKCFSTAIDSADRQYGGAFGRGQGWALEGMIPAYRVLKDDSIRHVIECTIDTLLKKQLPNGGWPYNLLKPIMGEDCKAIPVLAKCLLDWYEIDSECKELIRGANKALNWCAKHTVNFGAAKGGIFSYTVEGAVVHHMYTSTAFVYGSAYALEVYEILNKIK